jgi:hypothetical protein
MVPKLFEPHDLVGLAIVLLVAGFAGGPSWFIGALFAVGCIAVWKWAARQKE